MATQSPNNNITIKVSNIQAATSVNADGGSTWKQIESASTTLLVHNKLYIKYANIGGTYKNNVSKVTDDSGHELVKTPDNSNQYTVVTIPDGTTAVNIEYNALADGFVYYNLVFNPVKNLSTTQFKGKVTFGVTNNITPGVEANTQYITIDSQNSQTIKLENTTIGSFEHLKNYFIKDVKVSDSSFAVSFMDGIDWQNNDRNKGFSFKSGTTNYIDVYVDYIYPSPSTIRPYIKNITTFNPKIQYYLNEGWNETTKLYDNFTLIPLTAINGQSISNNICYLPSSPSYNSTFTKIDYVDFPITFKYDTPFRIENNGNVINSELVTGTTTTYQVTFKLARNSKLPYYASNQEYRVNTTPYTNTFGISNNSKYKCDVNITYTNQVSGYSNTGKVKYMMSNTFNTTAMFTRKHELIINNIWASSENKEIDSSYFCPYVEDRNGNRYMCYNGFISTNNPYPISGVTPVFYCKFFKYDIIKPRLIAPVIKDNNPIQFSIICSNLKSTSLPLPQTNTLKKYQFDISSSRYYFDNSKVKGYIDLDYWSNWGYNVNNDNYNLIFDTSKINELSASDKNKYAYDFDVVTNNYALKNTVQGNVKKYAIVPDNDTNKYFSESTDIYVYPNTSIKYVNNLHEEGVSIDLNLSYKINYRNYNKNIDSGQSFETERFTYFSKAIHNVTISNITTSKPNIIAYINVEYKSDSDSTIKGSNKFYNISNPGISLLNDTDLKQPITWNSPSITYTFTVVTKPPTIVPLTKYTYGITINGNNLPSDVGSLLIALGDENYEIKSYSEGLKDCSGALRLDNTQVHNSQVIYIDKKDCTNNTTIEPKVQLYNEDPKYYIVPSLLPANYFATQDSTCEYKGTINLSKYIKYNVGKEYASKINFKPISVEYEAYLNILNNDNTIAQRIHTGVVSTTEEKTVSIPTEYVKDSYNIAISDIFGISDTGSKFPIERYNLNLVNLSGESTSYNIYKPIYVANYKSEFIKMTKMNIFENNTWLFRNTDMVMPISIGYIYQHSYIAPYKFETKNNDIGISLKYLDNTSKQVNLEQYDSNTGTFYAYVGDDSYHPLESITINNRIG